MIEGRNLRVEKMMTSLFIGEKTFLANIKSRLQKETGS